MEKSPMRDIQNLYFLPFTKKALTLYSQKTSETAFFTVMSGAVHRSFSNIVFDLEQATDK